MKQIDIIQVPNVTLIISDNNVWSTVVYTTTDYNKSALSGEDREFIKVMDNEFFMNKANSRVAPFSFIL